MRDKNGAKSPRGVVERRREALAQTITEGRDDYFAQL